MKIQNILSTVTALAAVVEAGRRPTTIRGGQLVRRQGIEGIENEDDTPVEVVPGGGHRMPGMRMGGDPRKYFPAYNFVNATTPDATADGKIGVLLEPDLVPGARGKDGGMVRKKRIGPFTLAPGSAFERAVPPFEKPCEDCYITAMQLGLEYENGKVANADTGAWCHHIDLTVSGVDYTCPSDFLKTITTFADPAMGARRIFSTGNDRVPMRLNSKRKYGLDVETGPFGGSFELMNENKHPITVYMTVTFEFVPKSTPGYKEALMVWLDVTNCARSSDFAAPSPGGPYQRSSQEFTIKEDSYWLNAIGHSHDGGTHVELYVNGQLSCLSKQLYGNRRGGWIEPTDGSIVEAMRMPPYSHISDVGVCKDWGEIQAGDKVRVVSYYNDARHMQMRKSSGALEPQMGIMFTWIGPKGSDSENAPSNNITDALEDPKEADETR